MVSVVEQSSPIISLEIKQHLIESLKNLPDDANQSVVDKNFIAIAFFDALGFSLLERVSEYETIKGKNSKRVDYALRKNTEDDIFLQNKFKPEILVELKGKDVNLSYGSPSYKSTVKQLKDYLLAPNCKSARWGIITNSKHIQLFRKHGKTIFPATSCLEITTENIYQIAIEIKTKIEKTSKALTVAVYNNKGGVGKTTTVINLAATLTRHRKKVIVIDFDPNQRDLTDSLNAKVGETKLYDCLKDKKNSVDLRKAIYSYSKTFKGGVTLSFDVIPVDDILAQTDEDKIRQEISIYSLRKKLEVLKSEYDYILIDVPPNWRYYSISAIYAADVVLIPTKHDNIRSLQNAATTIQQYLPETQRYRQQKTQGLEWGAIALPIFFNGEKITDAARANAKKAIASIIKKTKAEKRFDLIPYFFPRYKPRNNTSIFELPNNAYIAYSTFEKIPAVYKSKVAYDYYSQLAKEYFLQ